MSLERFRSYLSKIDHIYNEQVGYETTGKQRRTERHRDPSTSYLCAKALGKSYCRRKSPLLPRLLILEMPLDPFESRESGVIG